MLALLPSISDENTSKVERLSTYLIMITLKKKDFFTSKSLVRSYPEYH